MCHYKGDFISSKLMFFMQHKSTGKSGCIFWCSTETRWSWCSIGEYRIIFVFSCIIFIFHYRLWSWKNLNMISCDVYKLLCTSPSIQESINLSILINSLFFFPISNINLKIHFVPSKSTSWVSTYFSSFWRGSSFTWDLR